VIQLEQIASGYPSRERFLTELALDPPDAASAQSGAPLLDEDYLILSTIHSAKGQEWKSVFVLNVVDGCIPSDLGVGTTAEIEEERRLLYVAMTRARDDLHLVVRQRFFTHGQNAQGDRHVYASRSRFIPDELLGLFEPTTWPEVEPELAARGASRGVRVDIAARMRGWHALCGRRLRRQYVERRVKGEVVHVEVAPGVCRATVWAAARAAIEPSRLGETLAELPFTEDQAISGKELSLASVGICAKRK